MSSDTDKPEFGITVEQISVDQSQLDNAPDLGSLAILPTKNVVLFPGVTISIVLKREISERVALNVFENKHPIGIVCQKDEEEEHPKLSSLYKIGVLGDVIKIFELPNGEKNVLVRGRDPFKIMGVGRKSGHPAGAIVAKIKILEDTLDGCNTRSFGIIYKKIKALLKKMQNALGEGFAHMIQSVYDNESPEMVINVLSTHLPFETDDKEALLEKRKIKDRAEAFLKILTEKEQEIDLSMDIMNRVRIEMDDDQRKMFLQRQIDVIHEQLYGDVDDADELEKRASEIALTDDARKLFQKEMAKLRRINPQNPDYAVLYSYLETLLDLPWGTESELNNDFAKAQEALDQDHCGLEKVKERILEQLAVIMHNPKGKAPILCLVGPPGVGKTSLGVSIAKALGRDYQRVSFGGLHDEAEIRGHRRTYIGAMPGRIIQAMMRSATANPVLVLDEVDKIGNDYKGDPAAALLEVLDPEQNCHFHDNYIDVDFDLSHVLFIATANTLSTVARPLIDRMEIINVSGYITEEKLEIARKHLLRRLFAELNIEPGSFEISDEALTAIIEEYTSESGVRQLEKALATVARKYLLALMSGKEFPTNVEKKDLKDILGNPPYMREKYESNKYAGVVTGLAWTEVGGEILLAEASLVQGKGKETLTGNLGQVMKESAMIAFQWVKAHSQQLGIDPELFEKYNLHVHFPEGAIPKDGPSAGITIATAIVSAFTQRKVRTRIAMTGEITLRGKVLPVGGIKEKILAAKRAGITDIVLSADNRKDVEDIAQKYVDGLTFHYVENAMEVMNYAIIDESVENPMTL